MAINWKIRLRKIHYWTSATVALPLVVVLVSGLFLQLKKQSNWVQPPTLRGGGGDPTVAFDRVLAAVSGVPEAAVSSWADIDRLDVRPDRGVIKIRARNRWEIQIDHRTAEVLQVAYRRSDLIEALHDGSFFHEYAKLGLFFPAGMGVAVLWCTGVYLFVLPINSRRRKRAAGE
jgi:uncharacterized iron-regulated membrane protein